MRLFLALIVASVLVGTVFSRRGLLDLLKFKKQIVLTKKRITLIEKENQSYIHRLEALSDPTQDMLEREVRTYLGWVKPSELVYFEK